MDSVMISLLLIVVVLPCRTKPTCNLALIIWLRPPSLAPKLGCAGRISVTYIMMPTAAVVLLLASQSNITVPVARVTRRFFQTFTVAVIMRNTRPHAPAILRRFAYATIATILVPNSWHRGLLAHSPLAMALAS